MLAEFGQTIERHLELNRSKLPQIHFENVTLANGFGRLRSCEPLENDICRVAEVYVRMFLPCDLKLDEPNDRRFASIIFTYGGPATHIVHEEFLPEMPVSGRRSFYAYNVNIGDGHAFCFDF